MSFFNKKPNNCDKKLEKFEKKAPIWSHFSPSSVDISKAICNHCGGVYSLGSDKPKNQTSTNLNFCELSLLNVIFVRINLLMLNCQFSMSKFILTNITFKKLNSQELIQL